VLIRKLILEPQSLGPGDNFEDPEYRARHTPVALSKHLSVDLCLDAYSKGIFPWDRVGGIYTWWSPCPRAILDPTKFHVSRSLKKWIRNHKFSVTVDHEFTQVMRECATPTPTRLTTWITPEFISVYTALHELGHAHSVEIWMDDELVGGIYGIALGRHFHGESMYSKVSNASKVAMWSLCNLLVEKRFQLFDCQLMHPHLASLGAISIRRRQFLQLVRQNSKNKLSSGSWDSSSINFKDNRHPSVILSDYVDD